MRVAVGGRVAGHKIGLTSEAIQRQLGVYEPQRHASLLGVDARARRRSDLCSGLDLRLGVQAQGRPKLGQVLAGADGGHRRRRPRIDRIRRAGAAEVIDARIADWRIRLPDTIADNASSAVAVIGEPRSPDGIDLPDLRITLSVGDEVVEGSGAAVLGLPHRRRLPRRRAGAARRGLAAGEVGAVRRACIAHPGAGIAATAVFDALPSVTATFR